MKKVLITGAAGNVGSCVYEGLSAYDEYEIIGTDIRPDAGRGIGHLDVTDLESCVKGMEGVDTVIHFAYLMKHAPLPDVIQVNYLGTYNIYEAARQCGVKRVVFGSSNHTVGRYRTDDPVDASSPYRPSNLYGLSKCHGELLGRLYADKFGISSINVRIGTYFGVPPKSKRQLYTWISSRDLVQLMKCCVDAAEHIDYLVLFGISDNREKYWDIDEAARLIGYKPQDDAFVYEREVEERGAHNPNELVYQGGISAFRQSVF